MNKGQMYTEAVPNAFGTGVIIQLKGLREGNEISYLEDSTVAGLYGGNVSPDWGNSCARSEENDMAFSALVQGY